MRKSNNLDRSKKKKERNLELENLRDTSIIMMNNVN
jgi:hypothetical protein